MRKVSKLHYDFPNNYHQSEKEKEYYTYTGSNLQYGKIKI